MTLQEFDKYMENNFDAYWTSFYIAPKDKSELKRLQPEQIILEIQEIDSIGLSVGNESLMIDMTVWADSIEDPIKITSKMLGSNRERCFFAMNEILKNVKTVYYSVNSNS